MALPIVSKVTSTDCCMRKWWDTQRSVGRHFCPWFILCRCLSGILLLIALNFEQLTEHLTMGDSNRAFHVSRVYVKSDVTDTLPISTSRKNGSHTKGMNTAAYITFEPLLTKPAYVQRQTREVNSNMEQPLSNHIWWSDKMAARAGDVNNNNVVGLVNTKLIPRIKETSAPKEKVSGKYIYRGPSQIGAEKGQLDADKPEMKKILGTEYREICEPKNDRDNSKMVKEYKDYPFLQLINTSVIGKDDVITTPFGSMKVFYCDYTASGKNLSFIEDYIRCHVYPSYANTHSSTGHNARQTGKFREEARHIIKYCTNCNRDDNLVFTGSGATSAMHKVAWALKINTKKIARKTVVFIGPYEHHSNILPWREYGTHVVRIRHDHHTGMVDLTHLDTELKRWKSKRRHLVVSMSAASNVSGIITDTDAVSTIAHKHGALAIFDYAAGGPYMKIDMNNGPMSYKDAVVISPHKFIGGPGTPGVLIAKRWVFQNTVPDRVGGGTVMFVTREHHAYVENTEEKEEGGTPDIIGAIRAGVVFRLKMEVGEKLISARDEDLCLRAFKVWEQNPNMVILGSHVAKRIPIFSFVTRHTETGKFVHHNFISTLLSDLFGIQARGGCACAGPYAEDLLGISETKAMEYVWFLSERKVGNIQHCCPAEPMQIMKPGFTRINLPYFFDDETIDFIIDAVDMVTKHGWRLLPQYDLDIHSGAWKHNSWSAKGDPDLESLGDIRFVEGQLTRTLKDRKGPENRSPNTYKEILAHAMEVFESVPASSVTEQQQRTSQHLQQSIPQEKRPLTWFLTPVDVTIILTNGNTTNNTFKLPFDFISPPKRTCVIKKSSPFRRKQRKIQFRSPLVEEKQVGRGRRRGLLCLFKAFR